jgi:LPS-assembly protein
MSCSRARFAVLACALFYCAVVHAQGRGLQLPRSPDERSLPIVIDADRIEGVSGKETTAQGNATLRRGELSVRADSLKYQEENEDVEARGNVRFESGGNILSGPILRYHIPDATGMFEKPDFTFAPRTPRASFGQQPVSARGQAESVEFMGENRFRIKDGFFTSCKPGDDSWRIRADQLDLDFTREVGTARGGSVIFKGVPVIGAPVFDFPLNNQRKSGLLPPSIGTTGKSGPELAVPYYLNLAPNYDLTLTPRYMEKRGFQIAEQFRYLLAHHNGELRAEQIPNDRVADSSRRAIAFVHNYNQDGRLVGGLNLSKVSDDNYFRDLATRINVTSQATLPRDGFLTYNGGWRDTGSYSATVRAQRFQVLQDPDKPILPPYGRMPQLTLSTLRQDTGGFDLGSSAEFVSFSHPTPTQVIGKRSTIYPSLRLPLITPGAYLTPKLGVHYTYYSLEQIPLTPLNTPVFPDTISRSLSIFSLDSGLIFERETRAQGQSVIQTLEPRIFYVRVPFRDQKQIPLFDTAIADFNYAQIFSENSFSGGDRINDADQLTVALTSRMLRSATGQEMLRGTIGQRYYFKDQQVTLDSETPRTDRSSDWLAALSGRVAEHWTSEAATQYNQQDNRFERLTVTARYQPEPFKTVNLSHRYLRDQISQVDLSGQWPLIGRWYGVGRFNYSLPDRRIVEGIGGFEYGADCWISRFVVQRFALTAGESTRAIFLQLELNGFSRLGSNPLEALKRNIPGYQRIGATAPETNPDRPFDFYD